MEEAHFAVFVDAEEVDLFGVEVDGAGTGDGGADFGCVGFIYPRPVAVAGDGEGVAGCGAELLGGIGDFGEGLDHELFGGPDGAVFRAEGFEVLLVSFHFVFLQDAGLASEGVLHGVHGDYAFTFRGDRTGG